MTNENLSIAEDKQIGKTARIIAGTICESKSLPFFLVSRKGRPGQLSSRVFATIKAAFNGSVPKAACDILHKDCSNNLSSELSTKVLETLKVEDLIERFNQPKASKKPSAKAKTSTKSKPTVKVTPKESDTSPSVNAFAKSLEINMKAQDMEPDTDELLEALMKTS